MLAGYFCEATRRKLGMRQLLLAEDAVQRLDAYSWPGNVRELEHVISRAALTARAGTSATIVQVRAEHLGLLVPAVTEPVTELAAELAEDDSVRDDSTVRLPDTGAGLKAATEAFQKQLIVTALQANDGNWAAAARELKTDRANLVRLAKRLEVEVVREIVSR
ncbi:AAA-type ATPase lid domain-containing protein [Aliamphritea spongicola]|nr:helix-turn-helix domain-containing protein [Aliamphritea spongicola]